MIRFACLFRFVCLIRPSFAQHTALRLWYKKPASTWTEALPVGNGRLGAMIFGDPAEELLQLNEATFWSGGPVGSGVNPEAKESFRLTRQALMKEDYQEGNKYARGMQGVYSQSYLPLADLRISQETGPDAYTGYTRELSLDKSVATVSFGWWSKL